MAENPGFPENKCEYLVINVQVLLARHAETGEEYRGRYIGSTDLPVSEKGVGQAKDLANRLEKYRPARCLCSPMKRTRQTAHIVCSKRGISCEYDRRLVEIDFGAWEGMSFAEIAQGYPKEVDNWASRGLDFQFPTGEKNSDFLRRVQAVASRLSEQNDDSLLVVSHGGVIRALICHFLGLSFESYLVFDVQPATFAVLDVHEQGGVLRGFNL